MSGFNFNTLISDEMDRQQAEPYGLTIVPTDDYDQPGPGGLRRYNLLQWIDGFAHTLHTFDTETEALEARRAVIFDIENRA